MKKEKTYFSEDSSEKWKVTISLLSSVDPKTDFETVLEIDIIQEQKFDQRIPRSMSIRCKSKEDLVKILAILSSCYVKDSQQHLLEFAIKKGILWHVVIDRNILSGESLKRGICYDEAIWKSFKKLLDKLNFIPLYETIRTLGYHELLPEK